MRTSWLCLMTLTAILLLVSAQTAAAETLYHRDGRTFEGRVTHRDGLVTVIADRGGMYQFLETDVSSTPIKKEEPAMETVLPVVKIETNLGAFTMELFEDDAPNTVANFVHLAETGFYDGSKFHRCIPGFVIQGGDPNSKSADSSRWGTGGPGYCIACEINKRKHARGVLSMAHAGKDTGGSQFFVTVASTPHLDGKHTVFGRITEGMDVVDKIATSPTGRGDQPITPVVMTKVTVLKKRNHPYEPKKLAGRR